MLFRVVSVRLEGLTLVVVNFVGWKKHLTMLYETV